MSDPKKSAYALATAFLAGSLETDDLVDRAGCLLGKRWRWLRPLARRVQASFGAGTRPRAKTLARFFLADEGFLRAIHKCELRPERLVGITPAMCPTRRAESWSLPAIRSFGELVDWLDVTASELDWFADLKCLERRQQHEAFRHYRYRVLAKRFGQIRLIEAPKPRLKAIQRQIHTAILSRIPAHDAAHGFRRGRSVKTFAEPHVDKAVVIKIDLQDFFPSVSLARVHAVFRTAGYPERVADLLVGLCSNAAPAAIWDGEQLASMDPGIRRQQWLYARPHLPQGAPTSPTLANLCAYRLDCRLSALAESSGAIYTRYADDLAFSGGETFARCARRFQTHVCATVMEEGFRVHHRKTRIMRRGVRQQLAGVVVNKRPNVRRQDRDALKAILTNCIRFGTESQNRDGHADFRSRLHGQVAYVESVNRAQGRKLRRLFDRIEWRGG